MAVRAKLSKQSLLVILMLLSLVATLLGPAAAGVMRGPAMFVTAKLGDGLMYVTTTVRSEVDSLTADNISQDEARRLKQANEGLQGQVNTLSAQLTDRLEQLRKVQQLRSLAFGPVEDIPCELIPARVVAGDSQVYGDSRLINARSTRAGLPVTTRQLLTDRSKAIPIPPEQHAALCLPPNLEAISSAVLAGRIVESGAFSARLQLVTDRGFVIGARIQRRIDPKHPDPSRRELNDANIGMITVTARGDGRDCLTVADVKESDNVLSGDWLVTRSDNALLPAQVQIGEVVDVSGNPKKAGFVNLKIRPYVDADSLREVFVVVPRGEQEVQKN
jgi:cell shape-determining protein MreC